MLAEGSRFGGYLVGPCIGEGGMARVYRAQHEGLQRQVALKVLLDGQGKDGEGHERFLREARMIAAIKHPNVVNIFDVGVHQGRPYLVMELLEGMDLEAYVASQGPLEEPMLMDVIIPVVAGLAAVHDAGIVHRDLKPGNIFLARGRNDEMEPKLLDFGISKSSGPDKMRLTNAKGLLMGTPFYMSPEASQGLEMTGLSDQYALGVVLYEAATGTNPFSGATTFGEVVRQVTTGDYPPVATRNPKLSKRMVGIIERSMHLDPSRRFPDMRAMGRELLSLAGQRTRITWGLSFSELAQSSSPDAAGAPLPAVLPRRESVRPATSSPGRGRYVLPAALVALALGGAIWMNWPKAEPEGVTIARAPDSPQSEVMDLRGRSTTQVANAPSEPASPEPSPPPTVVEEPLAERTARDLAEPIGEAHGEPSVDEVVAVPQPTAKEEEKPAATPTKRVVASLVRNRSVRNRRPSANVRQPVVAAPAESSASSTSSGESGPDWVVSSRQSGTNSRGPDRGTNNAPILD
ncbi:MAG: Serine/threonine-protein kinase PrkC [Pseudomonadota bacterium]|jgi:serine/threonine-protein kinase